MNPLHKLAGGVCDCIVRSAPSAFLDSLRRNHYEMVAREFNRANVYSWNGAQVPGRLEQFEDLALLFNLNPMGRGIIRQDFDEAAALFRAVRNIPNARGVEIGRFSGGSTLLLAVAVGPQGKLISIDIAPQDDAILRSVLQRGGLQERVELVVGDAAKTDCREALDFVFIDGDHSYEGARRDHNLWGSRVKPGGLIIHHDMANSRLYSTQWSDLARLRACILQKQAAQLKLAQESGSLAIFKKLGAAWTEV
jgi:predicted O-methyltransferase YrrM